MVHTHWKSLFGEAEAPAHLAYAPFSSCIEWELAQWVIKEKISWKSFDQLLQIPQIALLSFDLQTVLNSKKKKQG
ncbi:hypothetical protein GYMLUDRAFT_157964 [Collybiopsis luxurians FD-317 M1]|nr:hypothetical protein GYMLUDRAFT_157964 [Collybiopsis luxurians FD-317 M1]